MIIDKLSAITDREIWPEISTNLKKEELKRSGNVGSHSINNIIKAHHNSSL